VRTQTTVYPPASRPTHSVREDPDNGKVQDAAMLSPRQQTSSVDVSIDEYDGELCCSVGGPDSILDPC
jgi:hypothetical protein